MIVDQLIVIRFPVFIFHTPPSVPRARARKRRFQTLAPAPLFYFIYIVIFMGVGLLHCIIASRGGDARPWQIGRTGVVMMIVIF